MDGREGWMSPNGFSPNGLLPDRAASVTQVLDQERWSRAEERTAELIACIQPNQPSEDRRNAVARYVKCLIKKCFPCEVFTFGSVPLKTYLPDGDIDLTAFSNKPNLKDNWANKVQEILKSEENNENAEFRVKDVQCINAEVKIIKCLVEDVVVDISVNQLGGLCTLCFFEEVDNLINHSHLFKRSIILIKAWCYYESRLLGSHHGLISTYALETLVLYIFHVYDNSFAGPLEVLYRFLEFFSNFDWHNFCLSLQSPVPISSHPNMAADPPRNDGGELSLSKLVFACTSEYAVLSQGQANPEQPFSLKHFNIIDPLRVNNNLGRSVSKDCPGRSTAPDCITGWNNKVYLFKNRTGRLLLGWLECWSYRLYVGSYQIQIRSAFSFGAQRLARLIECPKENLIAELNQFFMNTWDRHGKGHRPDALSVDMHGLQSGNLNKIDRPDSFRYGLSSTRDEVTEKSTCYTSEMTGSRFSLTQLGDSSQHGKHTLTWMSSTGNGSAVSHTENRKTCTNATNPASSHQKHHDLQNVSSTENTQVDRSRNSRSDFLRKEVRVRYQFRRTYSSPELTDRSSDILFRLRSGSVLESDNGRNAPTKSDNRRQNFCPERLDNHSAKFPTEDHPISSQNSSHQHIDSAVDLHSASNSCYDGSGMGYMGKHSHPVAETMQMYQEEQDFVNMMASRFNINGQVQMQVPISPTVVSSLGYAKKNLVATVPTNIPVIRSPWISKMHYSQGLFPLPVSQYHQGIGMTSNREEFTKLVDSNLISKELNQEDSDLGFQHEQNVDSLRDYDHNSGGLIGEIYVGSFPCERIWETDVKSGASSRFVSSQAIPSRIKPSSEKFWDGSPSRPYKSTRDKHGRKSVFSTDPSTKEELARNGGHNEGESVDPTHQVPRYEPALVNGSNSDLPVASVFVGSQSEHNDGKNQGVLPFTLFPMWTGVTGIRLPTMLPMYNLSTETGISSVSTNHYDGDEEFDNCPEHQSDHSLDSTESHDQSKLYKTYNSMKDVASLEPSEHHETDILKSDFVSHRQNLQYGWFCPKAELHGPLHPSLGMVPPMYAREHFTWDKTGIPPAANINLLSQLMGYSPSFTPVSPNHPIGDYEHQDEIPRCRSSTGTYLPIHKRSFRGRKSSNTRNQKRYHRCDWKDHVGEREGSWNANSKPRLPACGQVCNQVEKPNRRMDRATASSNRSDKSWDSFEHDCLPSYHSHSVPSTISNSINHGSATVASGMNSLPFVNPSGLSTSGTAVPSLVMLYPYDQNMEFGSLGEQLEFGSLGAVHSGADEAAHVEGSSRVVDEQHKSHDHSGLSSLDQLSSSQLQR
ncbi:hypothetical protein Patl1_20320 [Pistacia atlantica]|uniref:Uncharacterized protein n=1 Tax=Pistacia atlantica TaxID=434234 RepID=A0ACC1BHV7_9ROSI|nr:hypothetical protein Patl1_20320 [Pistacia atlantica]